MRHFQFWRRYTWGLPCLLLAAVFWRQEVGASQDTPDAPPQPAVTLPSGFIQEVIVSGLVQPTAFVHLADGRLFIAQKQGRVRVYKEGALLGEPLIDIQDRVNAYHDRGLLGMAVDPDFATNGFLYLLYTFENDPSDFEGPKTGRLARYTVVGDTASLDSETVLLGSAVGRSCNDFPRGTDCIPSDSPSHSVGNLKFAPDGNLFVTLGDGARFVDVDPDALRAQDLDSLAGKVLRISPSGAGLPTNPYWNGSAEANRSKVWALGLRNAFRFNLHPVSGVPYLGDVGWGSFEEINDAPPAANFGWPCYEGPERQGGYSPFLTCLLLYARGPSAVRMPLHAWSHDGLGAAALGGAFQSGSVWPAPYQGAYFFGDFARQWLRFLELDAEGNLIRVNDFATGLEAPVDLELGPDSHLYYLSITRGELLRIRYVGVNTPPSAIASASPTQGYAPLSVQFSSAGSVDPEGGPLRFTWDFGDGSPGSSEADPLHTYVAEGTYTARLTVADEAGATSSAVVLITVGNLAPTATVHTPSPEQRFKVGDVIAFSGSAVDPEEGPLPESSLSWTITLYHCPGGDCHFHPFLSHTGAQGSFTVPNHGDEFYFEIKLTATDARGLSDTKVVNLHPQTVQLTLDTFPSGLQVVYDGVEGTAPFTRTTVVGSTHTLYTPSPQGDWTFLYWSDGGEQQHSVTVGETDATYTATFSAPEPVTCAEGEFRAEYFNNRFLEGAPLFVRCESAPLDKEWGLEAPPGTGVGPNDFSVRWSGRFRFSTGLYRFTARADDGVRVWVDGRGPIIDEWNDQAATTFRSFIFLVEGDHEVTLEYYEAGGAAVSQLRWRRLW